MILSVLSRRLILIGMLLLVVGCNRGPRMVPVSGIVTIDGKPLKKGLVTVNVKDSRPAYGKIGNDGKFQLMTKVEGDGCLVGEHTFTVSSREPLGPDTMRHLIPEKYADETTSGFKIKVDGPIQ